MLSFLSSNSLLCEAASIASCFAHLAQSLQGMKTAVPHLTISSRGCASSKLTCIARTSEAQDYLSFTTRGVRNDLLVSFGGIIDVKDLAYDWFSLSFPEKSGDGSDQRTRMSIQAAQSSDENEGSHVYVSSFSSSDASPSMTPLTSASLCIKSRGLISTGPTKTPSTPETKGYDMYVLHPTSAPNHNHTATLGQHGEILSEIDIGQHLNHYVQSLTFS